MLTFLDDYLAAIAARDTAALRTAYVTDGRFVWLEDGQIRYHSPDEVIEGVLALPPEAEVVTELEAPRVAALGATAAQVASRFDTRIGGDGDQGFSFGGTITLVLERDGDAWRIVAGHTSTLRAQPR